ncbi:ABC transporter ATP-binding protein [Elioraea tepidiphila]|uniref:ABC transporter ATP-binding protein n=1 Tax=Elioraea tepidiphila TaxID=457934 RepID=UPI00035FDBAC|nr:ABC transporter ATP-binding protein [Elioraea tepidiphila]
MSTILRAEGVTRVLPGPQPVTLVRDIDFALSPGEFVAVTGPSGSGKSSLLYLLGLLDRPTEGRISIEGRDTAAMSENELAATRLARLGFVFQFHFLLPEFTTLDNLLIPMRRLGRWDEAEREDRARALLASLGMDEAAGKLPEQLSGGMRQRAAIARALANDPALLLADEPTGNLDTRNARTVFDIFERLVADEHRSVIVVTHDQEQAARAPRQVRLVDGRIVHDSARD